MKKKIYIKGLQNCLFCLFVCSLTKYHFCIQGANNGFFCHGVNRKNIRQKTAFFEFRVII